MNAELFIEIRKEYSYHLIDMMTPFIHEGLTSIYNQANESATRTKCPRDILIIFQTYLHNIQQWSQQRIEEETNRIKINSHTSEYFDDLIKAVIRSHIILLTYSNKMSNVVAKTFYEQFTSEQFVHRCYTECGKNAHNNPSLFYHDRSAIELIQNRAQIHCEIQKGIKRAIRKCLPLPMILKEYLTNSLHVIPSQEQVTSTKVQSAIQSEHLKSMKDRVKALLLMDKWMSNSNHSLAPEVSIPHESPMTSNNQLPIHMSSPQTRNIIEKYV